MPHDIILVSDIHADEFEKFKKVDPVTGMNTRLQWVLSIFDEIEAYASQRKIETLLIGGDIFHTRGIIDVPVYTAVYEKLKRLSAQMELVLIAGNHDQALKSGEIHALSPMPGFVVGESDAYILKSGKKIGCVAFRENPHDFLKDLSKIATFKPDLYLIHQGVRGAKIAGDEILSREEVRLQDIREIVGESAWVYSGHYHIHQKLDERFYFIGSAVPKDFGDTTAKGFLHFDWKQVKQIESKAPKFMVVNAQSLKDPKVKKEIQGNYVKIEYEGKEPKGLDSLAVEGFVTSCTKVDRVYDRRSSIDPEQSPLRVIRSYVSDMAKAGSLPPDITEERLMEFLPEIVEKEKLAHNLGTYVISPLYLEIENFMTYRSELIDFGNYEGLTLVDGVNKDDPSANNNGAGKSAIPEALRWACFGDTLRGISGDYVVNNQVGKDCRVSFTALVNDTLYQITRYRKHKEHKNGLFFSILDGEGKVLHDLRGKSDGETQELICKELGLDERTFSNKVFFGFGFTKPFAALTDKEQKAILENVSGAEYFSPLFEKTKNLASTVESALRELEVKKNYNEKRLSDAQLELQTDLRKEADFERSRESRIEAAKKEIAQGEEMLALSGDTAEEMRALQATLEEIQEVSGLLESYPILQEDRKNLLFRQKEIQQELELIRQSDVNKQNNLKRLQFQIEQVEKEIQDFKKIKDECPTCGQEIVNRAIFEKTIQEKTKRKELYESDLQKENQVSNLEAPKREQLESTLAEVRQKLTEVDAEMEPLLDGYTLLNELREKESQQKDALARMERSALSWRDKISRLSDLIESIQIEVNPYADIVSRAQSKIEAFETEISALQVSLDQGSERFECYKFWERAFSDKGSPTQSPIKSYLFDAVVPLLDDLARKYLDIISAGSIQAYFNTVTALKSGELRDKFSVQVVNRYGAEIYEGDSGGERRKVDMAITFALHALARIRSGSQFGLVFFDEILDSLDKEGCRRIFELLQEMVKEVKIIFVVTHNEHLKGFFGRKLTVVKKNRTSKVIESYQSLKGEL